MALYIVRQYGAFGPDGREHSPGIAGRPEDFVGLEQLLEAGIVVPYREDAPSHLDPEANVLALQAKDAEIARLNEVVAKLRAELAKARGKQE